jgi:hypothetical protein
MLPSAAAGYSRNWYWHLAEIAKADIIDENEHQDA